MIYLERIRNFNQNRWPKRILSVLKLANMEVATQKRLNILKAENGLAQLELTTDTSGRLEWNKRKSLKELVRNRLDSTWRESMRSKSTLHLYRQFRETRGLPSNPYDNSRESRLFDGKRLPSISLVVVTCLDMRVKDLPFRLSVMTLLESVFVKIYVR